MQEKELKAFKKSCKVEAKLFDAELSHVKVKAEVKRRREEFEMDMAEKVCDKNNSSTFSINNEMAHCTFELIIFL